MSYDPNSDAAVEPILSPSEQVEERDAPELLDAENTEPTIPYPAYVMTDPQRERWRGCVGAAENMAEGGEYEGDLMWLRFVASQLYHSEIPTG
jgi:hypothetical protein